MTTTTPTPTLTLPAVARALILTEAEADDNPCAQAASEVVIASAAEQGYSPEDIAEALAFARPDVNAAYLAGLLTHHLGVTEGERAFVRGMANQFWDRQ